MNPAPASTRATLLAFDTSNEVLSVALGTPDGDCCEELAGGAAASAGLLPALERLLRRAGIGWATIDAIAFGRGPGAFTGLRTSCAVAQGLALGLDRPALAIDSLLIVAEAARALQPDTAGFDVAVAVDARMGEVYAARYRWQDGGWVTVEPPELVVPELLCARWGAAPAGWVAGSAVALLGDRLPMPPGRRLAAGDGRAAALLALARQAWMRGDGVDAAEALPLYLRDKVARTSAERAAAQAAAGAAT